MSTPIALFLSSTLSLTYVCPNSQDLHKAADILVIVQPDYWCIQQVVWQQMYLPHNQLDALFRVFIYFISLHVLSITMLIIRRSNCINTFTAIVDLSRSNFSIARTPLFQLKSAT